MSGTASASRPAVDDRVEQRVLVPEVHVQQALVGPGPLGDAVDPRPGQAVPGELIGGRREQQFPRRPGIRGPAPGGDGGAWDIPRAYRK